MKQQKIIFILLIIVSFSLSSCFEKISKKPKHAKPKKEDKIEIIERKAGAIPPQAPKTQRTASDQIVEKGLLSLKANEDEKARQLFQDAINIDSTNGKAYYYLALSNKKLGHTDIAAGLLDKAEALLQHDLIWLDKIAELKASLDNNNNEKNNKDTEEF